MIQGFQALTLETLSCPISVLSVGPNVFIDSDINLNDATVERIIKKYPYDYSL